MNYAIKLMTLGLSGAVLAGVAAGCAEKSSVTEYKGDEYSAEYEQPDSFVSDDGVADNLAGYEKSDQVYTQTIMVYIVGSDLESDSGAATLDMTEMEKAFPESGDHHIVVCAGGADEWKNPIIDPDKLTTLHLDEDGFSVVSVTDAENMGEHECLQQFITDTMDTYDTDLYSLILWDHGSGPVLGYGVDENYGDILSVVEMKKALENSVGQSGKKLEWIGFDACLMSSLEMCDAFAPYANYLISSQETEPGFGWDYSFLRHLDDPGMDGAYMGREIIDSYTNFCEAAMDKGLMYYTDLTLSCLDLTKYDKVEETFSSFFGELESGLTIETFPQAVRNRRNVKEFAEFTTGYNYSLVDAVDLIENLAPNDSARGDAAVAAIRDFTVYMRTNVDRAHGVSLCYPFGADSGYRECCFTVQEFLGFAEGYTDYVNSIYSFRSGDRIIDDWDLSGAESSVHNVATPSSGDSGAALPNRKDIRLQLTEEQMAGFGSASYYILCKADAAGYVTAEEDERAEDMYIFVHGGKNAVMDQSGALHAYYSNNVVYMKNETTGELSEMPMVLIDNDSSAEEKRYTCSVVLTYVGEELEDWETESAQLQIVVDENHPEGEIRSVVPIQDADEIQYAGKQLLSLDDYSYMSVVGSCNYLTRDDEGRLLPFFEWEDSGWLMGFEQDLTEGYSLDVTDIKNPENYYCMFVVTDVQGNQSVSELIPLA